MGDCQLVCIVERQADKIIMIVLMVERLSLGFLLELIVS